VREIAIIESSVPEGWGRRGMRFHATLDLKVAGPKNSVNC
jgi:hypothetical protein